MATEKAPTPAETTAIEADFIVSLGPVESLTFGGGKTFEDNGAAYQRG